jgi:tight adherence protein C
MNAQIAPLLLGLVSCCLVLRSRSRGTKPRSLLLISSVSEVAPRALTGASRNQEHKRYSRWPTVGLRNRTVEIPVPTGLRRWAKRSTISVNAVALMVGVITLVLAPTIAPALLLCVLGIVRVRKRRGADQLRARRVAALPDLVDMIRLCVTSGCTPYGALIVLGSLPLRADDVVGPLLVDAAAELQAGAVVSEVLEQFQAVVGEAARPMCSALRSSAESGIPIAETLDLLAREARRSRKTQADVAAKRLPVLLLFPLITCILPAFALLAIVPLLGGALSALHW